jgi:hypothetical protein
MMLIDTALEIVPRLHPKARSSGMDHHSGRRAHAAPSEHGAEHHDKHDPGVVHAPGKEFRNCRRLHAG